jgi:hypothetical protein
MARSQERSPLGAKGRGATHCGGAGHSYAPPKRSMMSVARTLIVTSAGKKRPNLDAIAPRALMVRPCGSNT